MRRRPVQAGFKKYCSIKYFLSGQIRLGGVGAARARPEIWREGHW